jgi:hypothetical protein
VIAALHEEKEDSLTERVLALLARGRVLTRTTLRDSLAVKNERYRTAEYNYGATWGSAPAGLAPARQTVSFASLPRQGPF